MEKFKSETRDVMIPPERPSNQIRTGIHYSAIYPIVSNCLTADS